MPLKTAPLIPKSISVKVSDMLRPRFIGSWNFPALDHSPVRVLIAVFILGVCFVRAYVGLWGSRIYTQDAFAILDGAWRILNGQRPHVDFYTGLGPVTYLITAAGVLLTGGNAAGLAYGQALFGCLAGLWAYRLSQRRLRGLPVALACAIVVLLAIVPTTIGDSWSWITPAATYNRYGYALVALLIVEAACASNAERKRDETWSGLSTGVVLGVLLFLKVSFFLGALFLLAAFVPLRAQTWRRWYGIVGAFLATCLAFACYLGFDLAAVYQDLRTVGHAKHLMLGWYLAGDVIVSAAPFLVFVVLISRGESSRQRFATLAAGASVCLTGFFLLLTSWQFYSLPLDCLMALLFVDRAVTISSNRATPPHPRLWVLLWGTSFALFFAVNEASGLAFALSQKLQRTPNASFAAPALAGFNSTVERRYVEFVNEGCELLNQHRQPNDSVLALNFTNPFSFGLGMIPPSGGVTWLQYHTNFDENGPAPERVFGGASLVMVPKVFSDYTLPDNLPRIYFPFLKQHYAIEAESSSWWLYRRTDAPKASLTAGR